MTQPPSFENFNDNGTQLVCKLKKAIYGLRQAPRVWFNTFHSFLIGKLGFQPSKTDSSLFVWLSSCSKLYLMAYVDDIVITGSSPSEISNVVQQLHAEFFLKDLGNLNFFLGIEVTRNSSSLVLTQHKFITDLLSTAGLLGASLAPTPMVESPLLSSTDGSPFPDGHLYRSIVGSLQYICLTRPDLCCCVNKLSQYMNNPLATHWKVVKHVLRYLIGTLHHGLCITPGDPILVPFSDADWVSSIEDRHSTSSFCILFGPTPVAWSAKKQSIVSRSSSEAEYRSLANCVSELIGLQHLLEELGVKTSHTPIVWCDNSVVVSVTTNPTHHARMKHVDIDLHFVREKVLAGQLSVNYVPSADQLADIFTKPIPLRNFSHFSNQLYLVDSIKFAT
ncbi:uncharacterized protein [Gossypium hirsutum]|uniref:Uncharacterized mitochondrial protein AtMg00810-like isoform X1 n=1 Tax=Gossypium hirsutum TaxID=3635 RepID=A0A1U8KBC9_GOSHI|nr:uncharacterized protein LOC107915146 isoform X1 [Gossypium hirsutum]XP_040959277.1 uncharacterized protein LOC107915146 isoform X1 [Gossypium hirsutum]XP_040959278.1 uncharacterized protein LOC107915146 isoform X1 [Gossypium hirsutum]XP_040959279.1 uncharacterized protein LOC107915146 isoform X1 [Gossypium hirsutum]XP_040959280.1 uncharacterized protein LOC107915146 isoform X1 [Gossypium hirsutum]XP_040959281.1 uncharacterized protein LOC107915146 isoform X1 [Gossypium hirsutum]XP_04095928